MMRALLLLIMLLTLSPFSFANKGEEAYRTLTEIDQRIIDATKRLSQYKLDTENMRKSWREYRKLSSQDPNTLSKNNKDRLAKLSRQFKPVLKDGDANPEKLRQLETQIDKEINNFDKIRSDFRAAENYFESNPGEVQKFSKTAALLERKAMTLNEVTNSKLDAMRTLRTVDQIEEEYDKMKMAAYVADKLAQFMNSDSFCRAKNHCAGRDTKNPVDPAYLYEELFPNMPEDWKRVGDLETYEKVHGRTSKSRNEISSPPDNSLSPFDTGATQNTK